LIGRLLYDSKNILSDQLDAIERVGKNGTLDLALLTDGLRAEREQGITIDVAYKYFSTPKRKFIIADAPGHIQYTRNMITGASNTDLIIILIDARNGVLEQTKRHTIIASLLQIPNVIVAVNKIDLVPDAASVYESIKKDYVKLTKQFSLKNVNFIPISALNGDNIVENTGSFKWYKGSALLEILESVTIENNINLVNARFPVQYVIRPQTEEWRDYRGYAGKVTSGIFAVGEEIIVQPSGISTIIKSIEQDGKLVKQAFATQSTVIQLEDDIDISRGDLIVKKDEELKVTNEIDVIINWMDRKILVQGNRYLLQINSNITPVIISDLQYLIDVNTLEKHDSPSEVKLNEIVKASVKTARPVAIDSFVNNKSTGAGILIDQTSNVTVGAVIIQ
jgi:sulfate adenylyltransferase subunit 1